MALGVVPQRPEAWWWMEIMRRAIRSIQRSLLLKVTLPTLGVICAISVGGAVLRSRLLDEMHREAAGEQARRATSVVAARLARESAQGHDSLYASLVAVCASADQSLFMTDAAGRVGWSCDRRLMGTRVASATEVRSDGSIVRNGGPWLRAVLPVTGGAACAGCHGQKNPIGFVGVDLPLSHAQAESTQQLWVSLAVGSALAIVLSGLLALVQFVLVHGPVSRLSRAVERIRAGQLHERVPVGRDDELGRLGQSLNEMAASLERAKEELDRTHRAALAQSEKLAGLGQLFTSIAHELKNQLAGITGALRVLGDEVRPDDPNRAVIARILAKTERMSETAVTALEFARPLKPAVTAVDIADLLDRTLFFIERQAVEQAVTVRKRYALGVPPAHADEGLLRQVFLNILLNGMQAMPRGGVLEVETRLAGPHAIEVCISDQGVGIPTEHLERIFSPFFSTKATGTGLGLYIARQIVDTQRGQIRVETQTGVGSTFIVRLPAFAGDGEERGHVNHVTG